MARQDENNQEKPTSHLLDQMTHCVDAGGGGGGGVGGEDRQTERKELREDVWGTYTHIKTRILLESSQL